MMTRRDILRTGAALITGGAVSAAFRQASAAEQSAAATQPPLPPPAGQRYTPVVTLNGSTAALENGQQRQGVPSHRRARQARIRARHGGQLLGL